MKDIKSEPEDVQDVYHSAMVMIRLSIKYIIKNKLTVHLNHYLHEIADELELDRFKFKKFIQNFSGNRYIDVAYISGKKCSKQRFYFIKENAIKKLKRNGRLKRAYADQFSDYECVYENGNLFL